MIRILTVDQQIQIHELWSDGNDNKTSLGKKFGVSEKTIRRVLKIDIKTLRSKLDTESFEEEKEDELNDEITGGNPFVNSHSDVQGKARIDGGIDDGIGDNGVDDGEEDINWDDIPVIITPAALIISFPDQPFVISVEHVNYNEAKQLIFDGEIEAAYNLMNVGRGITEFTNGIVTIEGGILTYKDRTLSNTLVSRIQELMKDGDEGFKSLINFLERLMKNTSYRATQELFSFLEHNDIKINEDGTFTGWKAVTSEYLDKYSKTIDNSVGNTVQVERNEVDEDSSKTCSYGLHVCALSYLNGFATQGDRIIKVNVDPSDVVAIPQDYNNTKMRCCKYVIIEDVTETYKEQFLVHD